MVRIHPSILAADLSCLCEAIKQAEEAEVSAIQIDVMDGHFVPNITFGPKMVKDLKARTNLPLEVHLMVEDPLNWVDIFADSGASTIIAHMEATPHLDRFIQLVRRNNLLCGVAINPSTSVYEVKEILPLVDILVLMGVNPGFHGQAMVSYLPDKLKRAKALTSEIAPYILLEVDGGVNEKNASLLVENGADILILGAAFYQNEKRKELVSFLRSLSRA